MLQLVGEQIEKSNGPEKVVRKPAPVVSSWGAEFLAKNKRQQESATKAAEAFITNTDGENLNQTVQAHQRPCHIKVQKKICIVAKLNIDYYDH